MYLCCIIIAISLHIIGAYTLKPCTKVSCGIQYVKPRMHSNSNSDSDSNDLYKDKLYGVNNFGDIIGGCETDVFINGVTFNPIERIVLTASGNLQRLMSAYYGLPVSVDIIKCENTDADLMIYDREVNLIVSNKIFCNAKGKIQIYDKSCVKSIEDRSIGVGQLFRYFNALPVFQLHSAGKLDSGSLWRSYTLSCPQLTCSFTEEFTPDFLSMIG